MLKKKVDLNYRRSIIKAEGSRFNRCKFCKHKKLIEIHGIGGNSMGHGYRCDIIGLEDSNRYAVSDNDVCNAFAKGGK